MNTYEQKLEDKRARFEELAASNRDKSNAAYTRSDMREGASGIPLGQPILVGHHSEGRHRAAIKRADNAMRASINHDKKADYYERRAAGVGTGGISSDDPEAVTKLKSKIAVLETGQEFMKAANALVRKILKAGVDSDKGKGLTADLVKAWADAYPNNTDAESNALALLKPDWCNRTGFASYSLTNNNANIRRLKLRLKGLEAKEGAETKTETLEGICEIVQNVEEDRIQFIFDGKPSADIRAIMKGHGFRWAPGQGAWQRHLNANGKYSARMVINKLNELEA